MFSTLTSLTLLALSTLAASLPAPALNARYFPQGTISAPANGTAIAPGAAFDFFYNQRGDYCLSSLDFSVWLLTSPPTSLLTMMQGSGDDTAATGWYLGRFAYSTISNEFPPNPAPSQLTMPDFSKSSGGFSAGKSGANIPMYIAVMEEWDTCSPTIGRQFSLTANPIIYNATSSTSTN